MKWNNVAAVALIGLALWLRFGDGGILPGPTPPIPEPGFRVLVVYDTDQLTTYPPEQRLIFTSGTVWDWLNANCIIGPDGKTPERLFLSSKADVSAAEPWVQAAMKRPRESLPWVIISDGKKGFEGPLPKNQDEMIALLKEYKGKWITPRPRSYAPNVEQTMGLALPATRAEVGSLPTLLWFGDSQRVSMLLLRRDWEVHWGVAA